MRVQTLKANMRAVDARTEQAISVGGVDARTEQWNCDRSPAFTARAMSSQSGRPSSPKNSSSHRPASSAEGAIHALRHRFAACSLRFARVVRGGAARRRAHQSAGLPGELRSAQVGRGRHGHRGVRERRRVHARGHRRARAGASYPRCRASTALPSAATGSPCVGARYSKSQFMIVEYEASQLSVRISRLYTGL